jgi:hypothetical protein
MTFKLYQLSPYPSTRVIRMTAIPERWWAPYACGSEVGFLRSWFKRDPDRAGQGLRMNWGALSGLVISLAVSGSFWAGVAVFVQRILQ